MTVHLSVPTCSDTVVIKTEFVYPPIPIRFYDWRAWADGTEEDDAYGSGTTEFNAISIINGMTNADLNHSSPTVLCFKKTLTIYHQIKDNCNAWIT